MAGEDGDTEALRQEAQSILREMGHNQGMTVVRTFAFMLSRIFKALFRHVRVNEEGVQRVCRNFSVVVGFVFGDCLQASSL